MPKFDHPVQRISASNTTFAGTVRITGGPNITAGTDASGVSLSGAAQTGTQFSGGISNIGNTAGDTGTIAGRLVLAGGNRVTLSGSTNGVSETVTISGPNAQTAISGIGASDTTYSSGTVIISGQANITVNTSVDGASQYVRLSAAAGGGGGNFSGGVSDLGNTAGDTGVTGTRLVFVGTHDVTLSQATDANGATVSILGGPTIAGTGGANGVAASQQAVQNAVVQLRPLHLDAYLTAHVAALPMNVSGASGSTAGASWALAVYTQNASTLSLATSASSTTSWSSGTNNVTNWAGVTGARRWPITNQTFNFTPGDYIVGIWVRTTNNGTFNHLADSGIGSAFSGVLGQSANQSLLIRPWWGMHSVSTAAIPSSIAASAIQNSLNGANERMPDYFLYNSTWGV